jgi:hypothetical protein
MRTHAIMLRNIPGDIVAIAEAIAQQTGLSLADVYRLALASGVLVEATRITPDREGTYAGLDGLYLARALRRHLGSAIDLLLASGEHPIVSIVATQTTASEQVSHYTNKPEQELPFDSSLGDDLESLGIGLGLSER